jgi:hypothetical protein
MRDNTERGNEEEYKKKIENFDSVLIDLVKDVFGHPQRLQDALKMASTMSRTDAFLFGSRVGKIIADLIEIEFKEIGMEDFIDSFKNLDQEMARYKGIWLGIFIQKNIDKYSIEMIDVIDKKNIQGILLGVLIQSKVGVLNTIESRYDRYYK